MSSELAPALRCGVVGAGIAGLGAAIALLRAGHDVEVFEKSQCKNEVGAAISIQPNAHPILERWGFDFETAQQTIIRGLRALDPFSGETKSELMFDDNIAEYGSDFISLHRVDLHSQLRDIAEKHGVCLHLGKAIEDVDFDETTLTLQDKSVIKKDLIVIASGIHCRWLKKMTGEDLPPRTTGTMYRLMVPVDKMLADPDIASIYTGTKPMLTESLEGPLDVFNYPCRKAKTLSAVFARRQIDDNFNPDEWNLSATKEEVLQSLEGMHPGFHSLVRHTERINKYPASHRDPLPYMCQSKVVLIGDAAHAMRPTFGQGANMAIEDAAALEVLFPRNSTNDSVEKRLKLFNALRHPRASVVQALSNYVSPKQDLDKLLSVSAPYYDGPPYPKGAMHFSPPSRKFLYNYDIFAEATKALEHLDHPDMIPHGTFKFFNSEGGHRDTMNKPVVSNGLS